MFQLFIPIDFYNDSIMIPFYLLEFKKLIFLYFFIKLEQILFDVYIVSSLNIIRVKNNFMLHLTNVKLTPFVLQILT